MLRGLGGTAEVVRDLMQVSPLVERAGDELRLWREHYNKRRPRTSLGYVPPSVFAQLSPVWESIDAHSRHKSVRYMVEYG